MIESFFKENNIEFKSNISLRQYNTYRINSTAKYMVFPSNVDELQLINNFLSLNNIKHLILGNGSNVIFLNEEYNGVIIKLDKLNKLEINNNLIYVEAGFSLIKLATIAIDKGLSGLEFAVGIPGSLGASIVMNAGAYNSDMASIVKKVKLLTPKNTIEEYSNDELQFSYRNSILKEKKDYIVLSAELELSVGNKEQMKEIVDIRRMKRMSSQPLEFPNAGSVFRNPENDFAGKLIEEQNLKGYCINDAQVSIKHANFIINKGNATGKDIVNLINYIKEKIQEQYNIELRMEQIIIE